MLLAFLALTLSPALQAGACGAGATIPVTDSGVAALRIGLTVAQVRARCTVARDTTQPNWDFVEVERVLFVLIGRDTVRAAIDHTGHVARLDIDTPLLRTTEGYGVGTPLKTLARSGAVGGASEATFGVRLRSHCGLRFVIAGVSHQEPGAQLDARQLRALGRGAKVSRIEVWPCRR